jgi:hypothetical protein
MFHELKRYLTSPPFMVAPEPSEPLLLYIAAIAEVVSLVLITERPNPQEPQVAKGASAGGSRSQDPDPIGELGKKEAAGSQLPEPTPSPEP